MKTLIIYTTSHGCTEKVAGILRDKIEGEVNLLNLKKDTIPLLTDFDRILIGGSIHAGQIQKRIKEFCRNNQDTLLERELGLFICCMEEGEKAREQLRNAFPDALQLHAKSTAILGGEFNFERMNIIEKMIIKKVAKVDHSVSTINQKSIDKFVGDLQKIFNPFLFIA
jgi:menaquinone-dependent protoporphyrinogen oxidase